MSKIYDNNGARMTVLQVIGELTNEIPQSHAVTINAHMWKHVGSFVGNDIDHCDAQAVFAHSVLDSYKFLPTETPEEEKSKKYCKYLLDRYMKSVSQDNSNDSAYHLLIKKIADSNNHGDIITEDTE